jgi:diguanylate cyclase (GGDEF)-like protein/PAS domain S-box-containing protein
MNNNKRPKIRNKSYIIFTLSFIIFGAVIALLTSFINYKLQYTNIDKGILARFEAEKSVKLESLHHSLNSLNEMVQTLAVNKLTQDYIRQPTPTKLVNAQSLFLASAQSSSLIMQVRFLDENGQEAIRIDRSKNGKEVFVVPDNELQDKHSRYYFIESAQLRPRQFWHSNLDLNYEGGVLEKPLRPTFRVATPVFSENVFSGIVIVNIEAAQLIRALTRSADFDTMIIDGDGEFLYHNEKVFSWSRYLEGQSNFLDLYPVIGSKILREPNIRFDKIYSFSIGQQFNNGENLQVILLPKAEMLSKLTANNLLTALIIAVIVIVVSFPLSWIAAMVPSRLQSQLQEVLADLQRSNEALDNNVMSSTTDRNGHFVSASNAFCLTTGYNFGELQGQTQELLCHPECAKTAYENIWRTIQNGQVWRGEIRNCKKSGQEFWVNMVITPQFDIDGKISGYAEIYEDITDRKAIELLSITDVLTQLFNRRKIDQILEDEMARYNRSEQVFSVILLDLDHFKQVNDTYGHPAGDRVLIETALCLQKNIRKVDYAGRWGGEEFLIVLTGTGIAGAAIIAEKLRQVINQHDFQPVKQLSASFGVAQCLTGESLNKLISRVDIALYEAKSEGRNRVSISPSE